MLRLSQGKNPVYPHYTSVLPLVFDPSTEFIQQASGETYGSLWITLNEKSVKMQHNKKLETA